MVKYRSNLTNFSLVMCGLDISTTGPWYVGHARDVNACYTHEKVNLSMASLCASNISF